LPAVLCHFSCVSRVSWFLADLPVSSYSTSGKWPKLTRNSIEAIFRSCHLWTYRQIEQRCEVARVLRKKLAMRPRRGWGHSGRRRWRTLIASAWFWTGFQDSQDGLGTTGNAVFDPVHPAILSFLPLFDVCGFRFREDGQFGGKLRDREMLTLAMPC
jgi:hypothetical protein